MKFLVVNILFTLLVILWRSEGNLLTGTKKQCGCANYQYNSESSTFCPFSNSVTNNIFVGKLRATS